MWPARDMTTVFFNHSHHDLPAPWLLPVASMSMHEESFVIYNCIWVPRGPGRSNDLPKASNTTYTFATFL